MIELDRDPDSVLDYRWDWTAWLAASETIQSYTVTAPGLTIDSHSATTTAVTAWFSAGPTRGVVDAVCRVTTNQGRTDDRTIRLVHKQR